MPAFFCQKRTFLPKKGQNGGVLIKMAFYLVKNGVVLGVDTYSIFFQEGSEIFVVQFGIQVKLVILTVKYLQWISTFQFLIFHKDDHLTKYLSTARRLDFE